MLPDGPRAIRARAANEPERPRLWAMWRQLDPRVDEYAALRSSETTLVVLEPRADPS